MRHRSRSNGLMRFLSVLRLSLKLANFIRDILGPIAFFDYVANLRNGNIGQSDRISTHISDKADIANIRQFDAFVQLLRNAHGPLCVETELARRFLLQCRGCKRSGRITSPLLLINFDRCQLPVGCSKNGRFDLTRGNLVFKAELFDLFSLITHQSGEKRLLILTDISFDRPVFTRLERLDFEFTLYDHA